MAIWHLRAQIIGRSKGKSAIGAAAYRSGTSLYSEYVALTFDYSKKRGVIYSEIITPVGVPDRLKNRENLWNEVERCEKRKDATLAREIEVALPIELTFAQQKELLREYINNEFISIGMIADFSIHYNDDTNNGEKKNPHAHIMLTLRPYYLEKGFGQKERCWNDLKLFEKWRKQWAVTTNKHLALNGIDKKIDHRSFVEQGIDLEPTIHRGVNEHKQTKEQKQKNKDKNLGTKDLGDDDLSNNDLDRVQKYQAIKQRNYERLLKDPQIALELLTHYQSVFSHEDLAKFVHARTNKIDEFTRLKLIIETHQSLVDLGKGIDGKHYYTSKQVIEREQELLNNCDKLAQLTAHRLNSKEISEFSFALKDKNFNEEKLNAFNNILSGNSLSLIVGYAGTGKSYLLNAVRQVYEAKGYRVVGTALSGRASDALLQSANINSRTIARFIIDWENERYKLDEKTVLVIDEIGMVGTRQMQLLIKEAIKAGAKIIGCGDPEQIPPIEAGCPFRVMLERYQHVKLKNVVRQKVDWQRQATIELSTRRHVKALDRYQEHGFIYEHETREKAIDAIVENWHQYHQQNENGEKKIREEKKVAVMMAYRNSDVLALNLKARDKLIKQNKLNTQNSITIDTKKFGKLNFAINDRIMFLKNDNDIGVKNGLMGTVLAINQASLEDNLHNGSHNNLQKGLDNHLECNVDNNLHNHLHNKLNHNLHHYLTIQMDRGDIITFSPLNYPHVSYAYASTVHKLQGETVDKAFVLATPHFDRFITNVSLDRHREEVELHYGQDDFKTYQNLTRTLSRGESKILAVEFAKARGIDYDLNKDIAAKMESKTDFKTYWQNILSESVPIKNTLAQKYLENIGIKDINEMNCKSLKYHEAIWNKESQTHMPGLIAQAVGFNKDNQVITKGIQVTYLNVQTANKENLISPVRYAGEMDSSIIMIQKPTQFKLEPELQSQLTSQVQSQMQLKIPSQNKLKEHNQSEQQLKRQSQSELQYQSQPQLLPQSPAQPQFLSLSQSKVEAEDKADNRWFIAVDLESAISIARANGNIRVACLSNLKNIENNPLKGNGNQLTLCVNQDTSMDFIERAGEIFQDKNFKVHIAMPKTAKSFCELYKNEWKEAIKETLENAIEKNQFKQLENEIKGKEDDKSKETKENNENKIKHPHKEINNIIAHFKELDLKLNEAKLKTHYAYTNHAQNKIEEYALHIAENQKLMQKLQHQCPNIYRRISKILEKEKEDIIER